MTKLRIGRFVNFLSLTWLAISTRRDIAYAVRSVGRYCSALKAIHWKAALMILPYINDTSGFGIRHPRERSTCIILFL